MSVKLLHEHHLELLSLKEGCTGSSESNLSTAHLFLKPPSMRSALCLGGGGIVDIN